MSGHSKWATIKRQKAVTDAKKGAAFTKLAKNICVAARGGKDPDMNSALRAAIDAARAANMPKDNIEKAILKGAGELPGVLYEEALYEGYGPGGTALIIEAVTDNTNRTVQQLRSMFSDHGGTLGSSGSVTYLFAQKGVVRIAHDQLPTAVDDLELAAIEAGAEDMKREAEGMTIITSREGLHRLSRLLSERGITPVSSGIEWITSSTVTPSAEDAEQLSALIAILENDDDVNNVYTNAQL